LTGTDFLNRTGSSSSIKALGYIIILAVLGTSIAGILYNYLIKISSVLFAASITYIIPVVAIIWGIIDGEVLYTEYLLWIVVIFAGLFLVNK